MKKLVMLILCIGIMLFGKPVLAKDIVYSLNKYDEEKLDYILQDPTGFVVAGTYQKSNHDVQVMLLKYNQDGRLEWKYSYGESIVDQLYGISYSYDEKQKINGYVLVVEDTTNSETDTNPQFLLIDLEGKLIRKQDSFLSSDTDIHKIEMFEQDGVVEGYILAGSEDQKGFIAQYDKEFHFLWKSTYEEDHSAIMDILSFSEGNYYLILSNDKDEREVYSLYQYEESSASYSMLKDDFEIGFEPHLEKGKNSFVVYGITNDVKLSDKQIGSYYMIKYNLDNQEEWETIGNTSIDEHKILKMQSIEKDNFIEYYILSVNRMDNSFEVIRANQDGVLQDKVKKLKNDYYDIHDFLLFDNSLYFVGQMSCPEEDNCDYHAKSLFLACTEDKVIEVENHDSGYVLFGVVVVILSMIVVYAVRKKHLLNHK